MEKIIHREEDGSTLSYLVVTIISIITFRKITKIEKRRAELKELLKQVRDRIH